ncbi:DUF3597 domain-containing protein [Roseicella aquatilis]|uniref:DUF3597 domain-containing protein n=1 Tax=Roseicella aquatilis TaxID=2527868 RepID=A0A4R4DUN9_9PROT|nr:DUF3597 domain-containing protein [Roseicella aquatilis]TCZ66832.1 DUF3597 domain-containing protein [Roseicella aquatilis]
MSIFGNILSRIMGHAKASPAATPATEAAAQGGSPPPPGTHDDVAAAAGQPASIQNVDVAAILDGLATKAPQKLDWQHSIVDLMKLLGLDSSLENRKELAQELGYGGNTGDSAAMNIWLHKQVMQKLAENGGKVPDALRT